MGKVIVIGGGASGLMAAIMAAREGAAVTLLEQMEKAGKKILITGNGRCNLTNIGAGWQGDYRGETQTACKVLKAFTPEDTLFLFRQLGVLTKDRNGLCYPYTDQAASVLEALLLEAKRLKVKLKYQESVQKIQKTEKGMQVLTKGWHYESDRVILCAGGCAAEQTGSDGSGYQLAKDCGHSLIPVLPALVPLLVKEKALCRMLSGTRSGAKLTLQIAGEPERMEFGEVQWTDYGISGIVVFQLSRYVAYALEEKRKTFIHVDFMPEYSFDEILTLFEEKMHLFGTPSWEELLNGLLKKKVILALTRELGVKAAAPANDQIFSSLAAKMKDLKLEIVGTKSFDMAQVCAGGVPLAEVDEETLGSKKMPGLYLAGEILNIDGACGGFNLQWAWASGCVAGRHAGKGVL